MRKRILMEALIGTAIGIVCVFLNPVLALAIT